MDETASPAIVYFLQHLDLLHWRDYLQEILTIPERLEVQWDDAKDQYWIETDAPLYVGKLVFHANMLLSIETFTKIHAGVYQLTLGETGIIPDHDAPLLTLKQPLLLQPGIVPNHPSGEPLQTTVGRVILNYLLLSMAFGDKVPYINKVWDTGSLEKIVGDLIIREVVTVDEVNTYISNTYFLGHAPELAVPNLSEKALVTDPRVEQRKKELLEQYKEELAAGDAVAMSQIEQELIKMDKAWLAGDSSMGYLISGKSFSVHRKKLLLTHGMIEAFGDHGNYDFVDNALEEGWTPENFAKIANEIRAGSYARAKETAKGGEESKFLARVFQNSRVTADDCRTDLALEIQFRADNAADYAYRNHIRADGSIEPLTVDSAKALIGQRVKIRSPALCQTPDGYCFACMGQLFKTLGQRVLATSATAIGAQMSTAALKKMHGTSIDTIEIKSLNDYVV